MKKIYLLLTALFTLGINQADAQCFADFQYFSNGGSGLTYQFIDSSFTQNRFATSYYWDFNGSISTAQNPTHTFSSSGTYFVCLTIFDSLANCMDSVCYNITVTGQQPNPCNTSYTYSANSNNVVNFTSTVSSGTAPYTYSWDFGDGSAGSTVANPTHTYSNSGAYGVTLTVNGSGGLTCSYYDTVYVNFCNAYFTYTAGSNGVVSFNNLSSPTGPQIAASWNFGDGTGSGVINPTHTYTASGTYLVTLTTFDSTSNCSSTYTDSLNIQIGTSSNCNASYTVALDSSAAFRVILYNTSSNFASHLYSWDFGDGTTGSGRTPQHQYLSFGSYVVCLTITDSALNCTSTFCDTVGMDSLGNLKSGFGIEVRDITVGIDEDTDQLNAVKVFPNPATNEISLDLRSISSNALRVKIIDITGKVILDEANQTVGNIEKFDLSDFNSGLYFILLDDGNTQKIEKFIKK